MNILEKANKIINDRSSDKAKEYGDFHESMDRMRDIFNAITGMSLTTDAMYAAMMALKLSRQSHQHKEDNLLDLVAYIGSYNDYKNRDCENS